MHVESRLSIRVAVIGALCLSACSSGSTPPSPTSPSNTPPQQTSTPPVTITVVGSSGSQAFTPNPASAATGAAIVWKNNDGVVHRIVFDDGSGDTGTIAPGASSSPLQLRNASASYHCTIHPSMVGSVNGASGSPTSDPSPGGGNGY